ncbi:hypothetical protein BH18ACT1_BH18ACT1_13250 [soil metagenome]
MRTRALRRPGGDRAGAVALEATAVLGLGLLAAVATTWPLALDLGTRVHNSSDAPFQAWTIDWVQRALTTGGPLWDANIYAPNDNTLAYSDSLLCLAVPLLPLRWLGAGPVTQLNVALLLGMATSAAGGYLLGRVVTRSPAVGALVGVAFAFGPFGTASASQVHSTIHVGVAVTGAAAWWLADRAERDRPLLAPAVLLGGSLAWMASVSFYPGAYAVVTTLVVLAVRWRALGRRGARAALASLAAVAVVAGLLLLPYLEVVSEDRAFVQSRRDVAGLGVDLLRVEDRLEVLGPVLGTEAIFPLPAFPGVTLLLLAAVGLVSGLRAGPERRPVVVLSVVLLGVGLLLGLGTSDEGWRTWSPYGLLFDHVPGVSTLRGAARAWIIGLLGLGLLAGLGAVAVGTWLGRRLAGRLRPSLRGRLVPFVAGVAVLAVLVEGFASWEDRPTVAVSAVDRALADEPREGGVLYLPALVEGPLAFPTTFGQVENVYGSTAHHRRMPNGYSGLVPEEWPALSERMRALPSAPTLRELADLDVVFVVVRTEVAGTPWEPLLEPDRAGPLKLLGRYDGDLLYELPT